MGLAYLWIDALCIRQGEESDKVKELPKMHHYYTNAHFVIQSSGTKSVDEGFLGIPKISRVAERLISTEDVPNAEDSFASSMSLAEENLSNSPNFTCCKVPYVSSNNDSDEILLYDLPGTPRYAAGLEHAASRAWILQEELLCRRILIFPSVGGVIFRCIGDDRELSDGNVIYDLGKHRPLAFPKKALMNNSEARGLGMALLTDHLQAMLARARTLAASGKNNPLVQVEPTSATLVFDHPIGHPIEVPEAGFVIAPLYSGEADGGLGFSTRSVSSYAVTVISRNPAGPGLRSQRIFTEPPPRVILADGANQAWLKTVDNYCRRKLTNPQDKWVAIAALAREYSARYGSGLGIYIAGVWKNFLHQSLLWKVLDDAVKPRPSVKRGPSWSWAAVEGAQFAFDDEEDVHNLDSSSIEIRILGAKILIETAGMEYESINGGSLRIKGKLLDCSLSKSSFGFKLTTTSTMTQSSELNGAYPDCTEYATEEGGLSFMLVQRSNRGIGNPNDRLEGLVLRKLDSGDFVRTAYAVWHCKKEVVEKGLVSEFKDDTITIH